MKGPNFSCCLGTCLGLHYEYNRKRRVAIQRYANDKKHLGVKDEGQEWCAQRKINATNFLFPRVGRFHYYKYIQNEELQSKFTQVERQAKESTKQECVHMKTTMSKTIF